MDETQNDAPFVAFYNMHAVTFVPPDEMAVCNGNSYHQYTEPHLLVLNFILVKHFIIVFKL